jgi:hypothetical protein
MRFNAENLMLKKPLNSREFNCGEPGPFRFTTAAMVKKL